MYLCISTVVDFNSQNFDPVMKFDKYSPALFTFKYCLDSGRYCILARHAKDEMNAARHSRKVGQPCPRGSSDVVLPYCIATSRPNGKWLYVQLCSGHL